MPDLRMKQAPLTCCAQHARPALDAGTACNVAPNGGQPTPVSKSVAARERRTAFTASAKASGAAASSSAACRGVVVHTTLAYPLRTWRAVHISSISVRANRLSRPSAPLAHRNDLH